MIDNTTLNTIAAQVSWIGPAIAAVLACCKPILNDKYIPLSALVLGIALGLLAIEASVTGGIVGMICGLSATGLYELVKKPGV